MPGTDDREYAEAVRVVLGELPDLPHVPELPGRGATRDDDRPRARRGRRARRRPAARRAGGSPTPPGIDHRRARSLLAQDLDQVEEQAQGTPGPFKTQVAGPWTLAATVEKPRGDKVLSDHGARRDLAQALAEGVRDHVADLRRRLPGTERLVVQVDEPALPAVLGGQVPTASGFGRHRRVDLPEASAGAGVGARGDHRGRGRALGALVRARTCPGRWCTAPARAACPSTSTCCAPRTSTHFAEALEAGRTVALGIVPSTDPASVPTDTALTERVLRWLDMLGPRPRGGPAARLVVTPSCGLAGASYDWARQALHLSGVVAGHL